MRPIGGCFVCGAACFEAREVWPQDHPRAGEPRTGLTPLPTARRVVLLLAASGHTSDVTVCGDCQLMPDLLPSAWRAAILNGALEMGDTYRAQMQMAPLEEGRRDALRYHYHLMLHDVPIGVVGDRLWSDVLRDREIGRVVHA